MLIDITRPIGPDTLLHPGDPPARISRYVDQDKGADYNLSEISSTLHCGTHFDFPAHFLPDGRTVEDYLPDVFITDAVVVDCGEADSVGRALLEAADIRKGDAVLLHTKNERLPLDKMAKGWVHIEEEAARYCVERGAAIVGADYIEVESGVDQGRYPVHETLLGAGILLLENINLRGVPAGRYRLFCLPILIPGSEAAPCRAVLETLD